jgi:serpin B
MRPHANTHFTLILLTILATSGAAIAQTTYATPAVNEEPKAWFEHGGGEMLIEGNAFFAGELLGELATDDEGEPVNLFFSPISIHLALMMTREGADGRTLREFDKVLDVKPKSDDIPADHVGELLAALNAASANNPSVDLTVVNTVWGQTGADWDADFVETLNTDFASPLEQLDFESDPDAARDTINTWVAGKTNDKIDELLPAGVIDPMTRMVLTNAVYFKGDWKTAFDADATADATFNLSAEEAVDVPTMHLTSDLRYGKTSRAEFLELPYVGDTLSMIVILPKDIANLASVRKDLADGDFEDEFEELESQSVAVSLPKFTFSSALALNDTLSELGLEDAFDSAKADFAGLTDTENDFYVKTVIHEAFVDVSETGTEAAAATAVVMATFSIPPEPTAFTVDRPFLFVIRHNETGVVLFIGQVVNPLGNVVEDTPADDASDDTSE